MGSFVPLLGDWFWWVMAGVLLLLELMAPGMFFIWFALAAGAVGIIDLIFSFSWQVEIVLFAALSMASAFIGRRLVVRHDVKDVHRPNLNQRQYDFIGRSYVLKEPIREGRGKLSIDSTLWDITGPDTPKGATVTVTGVDGLRLVVKAD